MVPEFNGGAYSPVTPNNGNPNTIYNKPVLTNEPVRYAPAFEQPQGATSAVVPSFAQNSKPPFPENPYTQYNQQPVVQPAMNQVSLQGYNQQSRSPYSLTLERPPEPTGRIATNTMYTDSLNNMLGMLSSLSNNPQPIPIGGGAGGTPPTTPGTTPTTPGTTPPLPNFGGGGNNPNPNSGTGVGGTTSNQDFWRIWNDQLNRNGPGFANQPLNPNIREATGGLFSTLGDLISGAASGGLSELGDLNWRSGLRMLLNSQFPGMGDLALPAGRGIDIEVAPVERDPRLDTQANANIEAFQRGVTEDNMAAMRQTLDMLRNGDVAAARAEATRIRELAMNAPEMTQADIRQFNELVAMIERFDGRGNGAINAPGSGAVIPNFTPRNPASQTGSYMAPGAAVMLNGFTQGDTRNVNQAELRLREAQNRASNVGRGQER